jgi:DNA-directed RNA polymerase alpha subunit
MLCALCGKPVEPGFESSGKCENCFAENCGHRGRLNDSQYKPKRPGDRSIEELRLPARTENLLIRSGIVFVRDLITQSEDQLLKIKRFGEGTLDEINTALAAIGLSLRKTRKPS